MAGRVPRGIVAYNDLKESGGRVYTGMPVGGEHAWVYPRGIWQERKLDPDRWTFTFSSLKTRARSAPEGSGAVIGTGYHWFLIAHQRVRKRDKDSYETFMEGVKFKIAHRRPHWHHWSTEYPDQEPEREKLIRILEEELARLRSGGPPSSPAGVGGFLSPGVAGFNGILPAAVRPLSFSILPPNRKDSECRESTE